MKQAVIVLPTYNEAGNIRGIVRAILAQQERTPNWIINVLVCDDRSPDKTGEIVQQMQRKEPNLHLLEGPKEGLGTALGRAFNHVKETFKQADAVITMDADWSHDPSDIPRLLREIDNGFDIVVGSRYAPGGLIPGDWPLSQIVRTRFAKLIARKLGGIDSQLQEITTSFRCMRRQVIETIDFSRAAANGYGFLIYQSNVFMTSGFKVTEVPIAFRSRQEGVSKMRIADVVEFFKVAYGLNPDSPAKRVFRYLVVGAIGIAVNLSVLLLARDSLNAPAIIASALGVEISILTNFFLHSTFTFREFRDEIKDMIGRRHYRAALEEVLGSLVKYNLAYLLVLVVTVSQFYILYNFLNFPILLAQLVGIFVGFALNYYASRRYIWKAA